MHLSSASIQHQHLHLNVTSVNSSLKYMKKVLTFVLLIETLEDIIMDEIMLEKRAPVEGMSKGSAKIIHGQ